MLRVSVIGLLVALGLQVPTSCEACEKIESAEKFEEVVYADADVWAVAFTSKKKDPDGALVARATELASEVKGKVKVACVDMKKPGIKDLAGEVGVRSHNVPAVRVFLSRARAATKVSVCRLRLLLPSAGLSGHG
jgi:hypothetical protein